MCLFFLLSACGVQKVPSSGSGGTAATGVSETGAGAADGGGNGIVVDGDSTAKRFAIATLGAVIEAIDATAAGNPADYYAGLDLCEGFLPGDCQIPGALTPATRDRLAQLISTNAPQLATIARGMRITLMSARPLARNAGGDQYPVDTILDPKDRNNIVVYFDYVDRLTQAADGKYQLAKKLGHEINHRMPMDASGTTLHDDDAVSGFSGALQGQQALDTMSLVYTRHLLNQLPRPSCALSFPGGVPNFMVDAYGNALGATSGTAKFHVEIKGGTAPKVTKVTTTGGSAALDTQGGNGQTTVSRGSVMTAQVVDGLSGLQAKCASSSLSKTTYKATVDVYGVYRDDIKDYLYTYQRGAYLESGYGSEGYSFSAYPTIPAGYVLNKILSCVAANGMHTLAADSCPSGYTAQQFIGYLAKTGTNPVLRCYNTSTGAHSVSTAVSCTTTPNTVNDGVLGYQFF